MVDWNEVRKEFPVCEKYVYLNPAGGSPVSKIAAKEGKRFYDEMLEFGDTYWETWLERSELVRSSLADFIGARREEIGFTTNTSHGMNLVAQMLKRIGEGKDQDEFRSKNTVLTMRDEFPSTTFPWLNQGFEIKFVEPVNHAYPIKAIQKAFTPDIKILVVSYVQYSTGFRQDLEALGRFCKENNLIFVVNATQALGIFPVDVKSCNIDFLVFTGLKWATAGYGIGGLYINKKWLNNRNFPFAGWRSVHRPEKMDNMAMDLKNEASVIESGCPHFPSIFALGGALNMFNHIGPENITNRVLELNQLLESKLKELGLEVICQEVDLYRSGILIAKIKNPKEVVEKLFGKNIIVSARGEGMRISTSIFNNEEDIEKLIRELRNIL